MQWIQNEFEILEKAGITSQSVVIVLKKAQ